MRSNLFICSILILSACGDDAPVEGEQFASDRRGQDEQQTDEAGAAGRDGKDGKDGDNGKSALVRSDVEPAGARCRDGGTVVAAGLDDDADGVLSDAEIDSSSYVCNGLGTRPPCTVFEGSIDIKSAEDIRKLTGCSEITGNVSISNSVGLRSLKGLESLQVIRGHLWIEGNKSLETLDGLQGLTTIIGEFDLYETPFYNPSSDKTDISNPALIISTNHVLTDISALAALTEVDLRIYVGRNPVLAQSVVSELAARIEQPCTVYKDASSNCEKNQALSEASWLRKMDH